MNNTDKYLDIYKNADKDKKAQFKQIEFMQWCKEWDEIVEKLRGIKRN